MEYRKLLFGSIACVLLGACDMELRVDEPDFNVHLETLQYKAGDTVKFEFTGSAGNVTFYSGLPGADYTYRDRTMIEGGKPQISFNTQYGGGGTQKSSLRVEVSSDLEALTTEGILAATWTDITSRCTIAPNPTVTPSGVIDVSDLVAPGKPFFLAFHFLGETSADFAAGNWIVPAFTATTLLSDGTALPVATLQNAGWKPFSVTNDANAWFSRGNPIVDLVIIGGGKNAPASDDWFVTKPLFFTKVPPDKGVPLQNIGSNALTEYSYVYSKPGTYTVTFLASNNTVDEHKSKIQQFEITVAE